MRNQSVSMHAVNGAQRDLADASARSMHVMEWTIQMAETRRGPLALWTR